MISSCFAGSYSILRRAKLPSWASFSNRSSSESESVSSGASVSAPLTKKVLCAAEAHRIHRPLLAPNVGKEVPLENQPTVTLLLAQFSGVAPFRSPTSHSDLLWHRSSRIGQKRRTASSPDRRTCGWRPRLRHACASDLAAAKNSRTRSMYAVRSWLDTSAPAIRTGSPKKNRS